MGDDIQDQREQVRRLLAGLEVLAAVLADGVQGDERIREWAGMVEMTAREFKGVPLLPGARFLPPAQVS